MLSLGLVLLYGCGGGGSASSAVSSNLQPPQTDPTLGIQWVRVEGGRFLMGSPDEEKGPYDDQSPQCEVEVSGFLMSATEVTNAQYNMFLEAMEARGGEVWERVKWSGASNPGLQSKFKGDRQPVVCVSWDDAMAFCEWVGNGVTLPTEAQWEYACRAGSTGRFCFGEDEAQLGDYAWYNENAGDATHVVAGKKANAWGLYDMHGNVWEWCSDWYDAHTAEPVKDPTGPTDGFTHVLRGGSWSDIEVSYCRSAFRAGAASSRTGSLGFRLVAPLEP